MEATGRMTREIEQCIVKGTVLRLLVVFAVLYVCVYGSWLVYCSVVLRVLLYGAEKWAPSG